MHKHLCLNQNMSVKRTHRAVATTALRAPLEIIHVETIAPIDGEVLIRVEYAASTPFDLHQVSYSHGRTPHHQNSIFSRTTAGLSSTTHKSSETPSLVITTTFAIAHTEPAAGTIIEVGAKVRSLAVGDKVKALSATRSTTLAHL